MSIYFKYRLFEINELCSQLFCSFFRKGCPFCFLYILSCFLHDRLFLEGWPFPPTHRNPHIHHTNAGDQILMKRTADRISKPLVKTAQSETGCDSKMSPKMKKGTFGFQNRADLFRRPPSLADQRGSTWALWAWEDCHCLGCHWHPWFSGAPGPISYTNSRSLQLAFTSKAGPQRMFAECRWKEDCRRGEGSLTDSNSTLRYQAKHSHTHFYRPNGAFLTFS